MNENTLKRCAVITGDVVKSSKLPEAIRRDLPAILRKAYDEMGRMVPEQFSEEALRFPLSVYRGDAFQMVITEPAMAVAAAVAFRALVLSSCQKPKIQVRMAIGIGSIDFVPDNNVHEGDGEAFRLSGRAIDGMGLEGLCLRLPGNDKHALEVVVDLLDAVTGRWTSNQARAMTGAMRGLTQQAIAAEWPNGGIHQSTVTEHLQLAHWDVIQRSLEFLKKAMSSL